MTEYRDHPGRRTPHGQGLGNLPDLIDISAGWEKDALCRGEESALFFGPNQFEPKRDRLAREAVAKVVCASCPAVGPCRDYALANGELYGVWGGLGEGDRRALLAGRRRVAAAV